MSNPALAGWLFDSEGVAVSGATVNAYAAGDTVTVIATTTTGAGGGWSIADSSVQNPDIEIVNGTETTRYKYGDKVAFTTLTALNHVWQNDTATSSFSLTVLADNLSTNHTIYQPITVSKSADETFNSSTLTNDTHLQVALSSGATYKVEAGIQFAQAGSSGDLTAKWNVPTGANLEGGWFAGVDGVLTLDVATEASSAGIGPASSAADATAFFAGYVETSNAAGTLIPQWRQDNADASVTTVGEFSWMTVTRMS